MLNVTADWRTKSACLKEIIGDPLLLSAWEDQEDPGAEHARAVCKTTCAVQAQCLIDALADPFAQGVRGGYYFNNGVLSLKDSKALGRETGLMGITSQRRNRVRQRAVL